MLKFGNDILKVGTSWIDAVDYNPLNLQPYTIRFKYHDEFIPTTTKGILTQVSSEPNIWDLTYENTDWSYLVDNVDYSITYLTEILGVNSTGVTNMEGLFRTCTSMLAVPLFDTSSVTNMSCMFFECERLTSLPLLNTHNVTDMHELCRKCRSLTSIPLFDTTNVTNVDQMFEDCYRVQSGALALYKRMSKQATPPVTHSDTFMNCGAGTTTGAAELAQIPTSWGGRL